MGLGVAVVCRLGVCGDVFVVSWSLAFGFVLFAIVSFGVVVFLFVVASERSVLESDDHNALRTCDL